MKRMCKSCALVFVLIFCHQCLSEEKVKNATFGIFYEGAVSSSLSFKYMFYYYETKNLTQAVRILARTQQAPIAYPLLLVVRQQRNVQSFQLPVLVQSVYPYQYISRTLCPVESQLKDPDQKIQTLTVDISSDVASWNKTSFVFSAEMLGNFSLNLSRYYDISLTPPEPQYYLFTFPHDVESVDVRVNSSDKYCAILSIQNIHCPVYDDVHDVQNSGSFQTVTTSGTITVEKRTYDTDSFYVVLMVKADDEGCTSMRPLKPSTVDDSLDRKKLMSIFIAKSLSVTEYVFPVLTACAFFVAFYVAAFLLIFVYHCCERRYGETSNEGHLITNIIDEGDGDGTDTLANNRAPTSSRENPMDDHFLNQEESHVAFSINRESMSPTNHISSSRMTYRHVGTQCSTSFPHAICNIEEVDEHDIDMLHDASTDADVVAMNRVMYVTDLAKKKALSLEKKYIMYHWYIIIIAVFYGLPVIQLVLTYQQALLTSGNQDICYYNFDCARPYYVFSAFNNVFSNIGYIMLGLLFFLLTWRRAILHRRICAVHEEVDKYYGLPQHFGLFYSMGIALTVEGIMSACYHVCPSYNNFQFDTAFMYILASLTMLKIYQNRHPDINAPAHVAYMLMACIILVGVIGVVYASLVFWIIITCLFLIFSVLMTVEVYYMGRWRFDLNLPRRIYLQIRHDRIYCLRPLHPSRMVFLIIVNCANWTIAFYGAFKQPEDFPSFLLAIFMGNLLMYYFFYIIMKISYREHIHAFPCCYIALSCLTWGAGIYFFLRHSNSWEMTPAQSRSMNKPCLLFNFYDEHDVWHFLSALSMFFSFMSLLNLDDDLYLTPRHQIPVF